MLIEAFFNVMSRFLAPSPLPVSPTGVRGVPPCVGVRQARGAVAGRCCAAGAPAVLCELWGAFAFDPEVEGDTERAEHQRDRDEVVVLVAAPAAHRVV